MYYVFPTKKKRIQERESDIRMQEGYIFECLLDGMEYVVKNIANRMVVLQSRKGDRRIITGVDTLTINHSIGKEKKVNQK